MSEKTRYSDEELHEFKEHILEKLEKAQREYDSLRSNINISDGNDFGDTCATFKILEECAASLSKEVAWQLAQRQMK
ncbi:MAG: TraR/DksA family transcriptional regulator, partial [Duncaniella sp.]|nr:TraR/DksA family transcriptional regulator [Duncaniella sp.]